MHSSPMIRCRPARSRIALLACPLFLGLLWPLFRPSNRAQEIAAFYQSPGTRKMATLLRKIFEDQDWKTDPNKAATRAQYYKQMLEAKPDFRNELKIRQALAECDYRPGIPPTRLSNSNASANWARTMAWHSAPPSRKRFATRWRLLICVSANRKTAFGTMPRIPASSP